MQVIAKNPIFEATHNENGVVTVKNQNGGILHCTVEQFEAQFEEVTPPAAYLQSTSVELRFVVRAEEATQRQLRILQQRVGDGEWSDVPTAI